MPAIWTWEPSFNLTRQLVIQDDLPSSADGYGERDTDSLKPPEERATFSAEGLTFDEVLAVRAVARTRAGSYTASTHHGDWTGQLENLNARPVKGTLFWEASITMLVEESPFE